MGDQPLHIENALREPALPADLVERYGIRAYVGFPLRVAGKAVGSFCVIDEQFAAGRLTLEEFQRGLGALASLGGALEKGR